MSRPIVSITVDPVTQRTLIDAANRQDTPLGEYIAHALRVHAWNYREARTAKLLEEARQSRAASGDQAGKPATKRRGKPRSPPAEK